MVKLPAASAHHRLGFNLALSNVLSAGVTFAGTMVLAAIFGVAEMGALGVVVSATMILSPLVQFRLDLAFERFGHHLHRGLVATVHCWAALVAGVGALLGLLLVAFAQTPVSIVGFTALNLFLANCSNITWAEKVGRRDTRAVFTLQFVRAIVGVAAPITLHTFLEARLALLLGLCLSNCIFLFFLPKISFYGLKRIRVVFRALSGRGRDLLWDNTFPVMVNMASVYIAPIVVSSVFGLKEAGVIYLIFRLVLTPAQLLADPIRRSTYASIPTESNLTADKLRGLRRFSVGFLAAGLVGFVLAGLVRQRFLEFFPAYADTYFLLAGAAVWGGLVIGNAPLTGLVPVLRIAKMQSIVELAGLAWRLGSLSLGLLGASFQFCLAIFIAGTIVLNLGWGALIYRICVRRANIPASP
ncbi:hypothetical protein [Caulobacter sp. RHG1]|uniref:hypothetical protein n=1 Tax=Caulobacter sp. (strain RHG1) TaxID=2545762 RepID=UPI001557BDB2|nr:hypothetical protein [Caulobacter sp. RHG1]